MTDQTLREQLARLNCEHCAQEPPNCDGICKEAYEQADASIAIFEAQGGEPHPLKADILETALNKWATEHQLEHYGQMSRDEILTVAVLAQLVADIAFYTGRNPDQEKRK